MCVHISGEREFASQSQPNVAIGCFLSLPSFWIYFVTSKTKPVERTLIVRFRFRIRVRVRVRVRVREVCISPFFKNKYER
jgi:hypothetical protein